MKPSELKPLLLEIPNQDVINNSQVTFNFSYINFSLTLKGVYSIYEFVYKQHEGWKKVVEKNDIKADNELYNSLKYFQGISSEISSVVKNNSFANYWNNVNNRVQNTNLYPLLYDCPETEFLLQVLSERPKAFSQSHYYITGRISQIQSIPQFEGYVLAYEFKNKDHSEILNRRNKEKASISKIRNDFQNYLNESEQTLYKHLKNANDNYDKSVTIIDELKEEKNNLFQEWFEKSNNEFDSFDEASRETIKELEETYKEKLKLSAPAEYWKERAARLRERGKKALQVLVGLVLFVCVFLGFLLWISPDQIFLSFFNEDRSAAIRWSVVFITFISFLAFCIKAITKVMFSSYHLASDCDERYTLTYFYLALLKDSDVSEQDRQLVMQSLFSRAESGLLKDDSSPAMPGIVEKIISGK